MTISRTLQSFHDRPRLWSERSPLGPHAARTPGADDGAVALLIRRAKGGEAAALDELADRLQPVALRWSMKLLRNRADAEDATQDALLRWFATLERFECGRSPWPWLRRIVTNAAIDVLRRRGRRETAWSSLVKDGEEDHFDPVDPGRETAEERLDRRRSQELLRRAVRDLPAHHRLVIELREFEGLSYREIADRAEIPLGTVMSRLHAARRRLAELVTVRRREAQREADRRSAGLVATRRRDGQRSLLVEQSRQAVPA